MMFKNFLVFNNLSGREESSQTKTAEIIHG